MISIAGIPALPRFSLIESAPFGFLTFPKMTKFLIVFMFLSLFEISFDEASSLQSKYLLIAEVRILKATICFCCLGLIFCSTIPLNPSTRESLLTISLSLVFSIF
jgi:hypothetical protein